MTKIEDILVPARVLIDCHINSKKRVLEFISKIIAEYLPEISYLTILEGFLAREKLGSTVITEGIAVPHTRLDAVTKPIGAFLRLHEPIAYDTHDEQKVDMLFGIVMPANDKQQHVSVLSCLAECFQCQQRIQRIREARTVDQAFEMMTLCQADVALE